MKKIFHFMLVILVILVLEFILSSSYNSVSAAKYMGDVDGNGKISAADAQKILKVSSQLEKFNYFQKAIADIDYDYEIEAADSRAVLQMSSGLKAKVVQGNDINQRALCIAANELHKTLETKKYKYDCAKPSSVTQLEGTNRSVCCASYVSGAIYKLGGNYATAMKELGSNFRSSTALKNKLAQKTNLFTYVGQAKSSSEMKNLFAKLKPGDIVFCHNSRNDPSPDHVQMVAKVVNGNYYWFNAGNTKDILRSYEEKGGASASNFINYAGFQAITVYRIK